MDAAGQQQQRSSSSSKVEMMLALAALMVLRSLQREMQAARTLSRSDSKAVFRCKAVGLLHPTCHLTPQQATRLCAHEWLHGAGVWRACVCVLLIVRSCDTDCTAL